jgi:RNA polymerase sigma-70 factor, ECF subfamily
MSTSAAVATRPSRLETGVDETRLVAALRGGEESAFAELIDRYQSPMLSLAQRYVRSRAVAQEVVQETWLSVLKGIDRFEERSSLKTWLFRILVNQAKSRGVRESRNVPFSALEGDASEPSVEPERFLDANHDRWPGHWAAYPSSWSEIPEQRLLSRETLDYVRDAIDGLPERQKVVVTMRDVEGWSPEEVCSALEITDANQRILLHRARSKIRRELERYLDDV